MGVKDPNDNEELPTEQKQDAGDTGDTGDVGQESAGSEADGSRTSDPRLIYIRSRGGDGQVPGGPKK